MQFDTVVNYMGSKILGNSSYVDVDHFEELHFDEQHFDDQHFNKLHFNQHFDVNLEVAEKAREDVEEISEDCR